LLGILLWLLEGGGLVVPLMGKSVWVVSRRPRAYEGKSLIDTLPGSTYMTASSPHICLKSSDNCAFLPASKRSVSTLSAHISERYPCPLSGSSGYQCPSHLFFKPLNSSSWKAFSFQLGTFLSCFSTAAVQYVTAVCSSWCKISMCTNNNIVQSVIK
jgi:hypothetical protein